AADTPRTSLCDAASAAAACGACMWVWTRKLWMAMAKMPRNAISGRKLGKRPLEPGRDRTWSLLEPCLKELRIFHRRLKFAAPVRDLAVPSPRNQNTPALFLRHDAWAFTRECAGRGLPSRKNPMPFGAFFAL